MTIPMKTSHLLPLSLAIAALAFAAPNTSAAVKLTEAELADEIKDLQAMPPEERRVKQRELMDKLTPEQREKARERLLTLRPGGLAAGQNLQALTPEEREARMKQLKEMADKQIADLEKKQSDGTITEQEKTRLTRAKQAQERLKNGQPPLLGPGRTNVSGEDLAARTKALREQAAKRLADLEKKQADGTITEQEKTQLQRLKTMQARQKAP